MISKTTEQAKIEQLEVGEECTVCWVEGGGGVVRREESSYVLYEVPQYGGSEALIGLFPLGAVGEIVDTVISWT